MLKPEYTTKFKKDLKAVEKRNLDIELLKEVIKKLCLEEPLPAKNKDHNLSGNWSGVQRMSYFSGLAFNLSNRKRHHSI